MGCLFNNVFLINLESKQDRWNRFSNLNLGIERINAVDTRNSSDDYENFGLGLNPPDKMSKLYFSRSKGALGCYLSHYTFWKKVVENDIEYAVVLEDDASVIDVKNLIETNSVSTHFENVDFPKLVQLNKRTSTQKLPYWFDGTESYAINKKAASSLIELTHDLSDLQGVFIEYAWSWPNLRGGAYSLFKRWKRHDALADFTKKNTIRYAVDKFIGYCSLDEINPSKRLTIELDPTIGLNPYYPHSEILKDLKPYWQMSYDELVAHETDDDYMWWEQT